MKIVHIADTHLGYNAYRAIDKETGQNLREKDTNEAFKQTIDKILQIKPQAVIHSGDFFDSSRPSNRIISFALEQLLRLSSKDIPVIIISGNHSTPRLKDWGSIFSLFKFFPNIYPVFEGKYGLVKIGKLKAHCIPQCQSKEAFNEELAKLKSVDFKTPFNVLVTHAAVAGIKEFLMDSEFNELLITKKQLDPRFDYIALGHYHRQVGVTENAYYAGSTEHFSFLEASDEKGFLVIDLDKKSVEPVKLAIRPMSNLPAIDALNKEPEAVLEEVKKVVSQAKPEGKIIRLNITNLTAQTYRQLDFETIKNILSTAAFYLYNFQTQRDGELSLSPESFGNLDFEFKQFVLAQKQLKNKKELTKLGLSYLEKVQEEIAYSDSSIGK